MRSQAIYNAIITAVTGLTTTGNYVYPNRQYAIPKDVAEALSVRIGSDVPAAGDDAYTNNVYMDRLLTVYVRIHVKAGETSIDDQLLQIEREIWQALMADTTLGLAYVHQITPGGREEPDVDELAEKPGVQCDTVWRVHYRHSLTDPGA